MYNRLNTVLLSSVLILFVPSVSGATVASEYLGPLVNVFWILVAVLIILNIGLIALVVIFLMNLSRLLKTCGEQATTSPNLVWLNLVPVFNFGWMIYTVIKVSESIERSFEANGSQDPGKGARLTGIIFSISFAIAPFIPVAIPVCLISWMIYWSKINSYNMALKFGGRPPLASSR